ncbi:glycerol-3-phosphate acyltransferase PlsY [Aequitasia blattaphilus]|uniref:Glycerol-3-phosphate acyltransferase n=1 Tax=Aequitasia blattaphilus TaxID=2949332 RepID=A0ABT1EAK6_9FIRM|nr:glycerol-3-phosphate 1-O-acyltransferase PlsY [Aequitasia blattaphilus]MCP1101542.1 glycerol-3-phosphate 1-O-acyltransferase PlsY [Aequitasia blattaphilus]MCR8614182.1 glycerol-3-phosphate 1-O-acyltransferase PlsY [Aequitasia blattaphilus]
MERIICVLIGYLFGLLQTGYFIGRLNNVDIRKMGSGNAGTTNALRTLGKRAGAVTLLGDCFKCVAAVLLVHFIFGNGAADLLPVLSMYAGAGVILGHNFPFYLGFKGGKGIAATAGLIISTTNIWIVLICLVAFVGIVAISRYVSVGSLLVVSIFFAAVVILGQNGYYHTTGRYLGEIYGVAFFVVIIAFFQHRENIKRLIKGNENKIGAKKK